MKNTKNIIIFLLIIIIISIISAIKTIRKREEMQKSVEIVISRYNEDLNWLKEEPFNNYTNITIYNKGKNSDFFHKPGTKIINLENVGRCDHTYLYHVITQYDNLKDITIFLPGSADMGIKMDHTKNLFNEIEKNNQAVFANARTFSNPLKEIYADFQMDEWKASDSRNTSINSESKLEPSKHRPYGIWYDYYLGAEPVYSLAFYGIFSVAKEDIKQHPKSYYENLIKDLSNSSNPEVGHYFERSWVAIFHPLKHTLIVNE